MPAPKNRINTYILLAAILVAAIAAYYLPRKQPDTSHTMSPKEHLELAEQKKAQRLYFEQELEQQARDRAEQPQAPSSESQP